MNFGVPFCAYFCVKGNDRFRGLQDFRYSFEGDFEFFSYLSSGGSLVFLFFINYFINTTILKYLSSVQTGIRISLA